MSQLALPLQLADHAVFASFLPGGNAALVATLQALADGGEGHGCWLWGANSTGKTHLLQAVCEDAGDRSAYVPLSLFSAAGADILDGLASRELVCIDDIDRVVGDDEFTVAQLIEGSFLTPKLVGDRIGLHPVVVIFAIAAGGQLFGFFGILLALPAAAVLSVLIRFAYHRYLKEHPELDVELE